MIPASGSLGARIEDTCPNNFAARWVLFGCVVLVCIVPPCQCCQTRVHDGAWRWCSGHAQFASITVTPRVAH